MTITKDLHLLISLATGAVSNFSPSFFAINRLPQGIGVRNLKNIMKLAL